VAVTPTVKLLERSLVVGLIAGAALGACFMLGLAVLEILSGHATELELVPIAVAAAAAAAAVGAVVGVPVGLVAGLGARVPLARGNVTAARAIVGSVGAIGAGATLSLVYGPLGLWGMVPGSLSRSPWSCWGRRPSAGSSPPCCCGLTTDTTL
jgi:hypothetical protein